MPDQLTHTFSWPNAIWSFILFCFALGIILWKLRRLREEIHNLVVHLPHMGSEFLKGEMEEMREGLRQTRARVQIVEEKIGLNGITESG